MPATHALPLLPHSPLPRLASYSFRTPLLLQLDWEMIKTLDKDGNGIDKLEFIVGMLELLGLVEA